MIIYLYGPDTYRRQQKIQQITNQYIKKYSKITTDRIYVNEDKKEIDKLYEQSTHQSLFDGKRMVVISGILDLNTQETRRIATFLKEKIVDEKIIIVITEEKKLSKEFDFIHKPSLKTSVIEQSFEYMNPEQLRHYIITEMQQKKIHAAPHIINTLIQMYAKDTWGLITELEKITLSTLDYAVQDHYITLEGGLFNQLYRLKSSLTVRIPTLEKLLHLEDAGKIFNMVAYQHILSEPATFADYDELIKNGKMDYDLALIDIALKEK